MPSGDWDIGIGRSGSGCGGTEGAETTYAPILQSFILGESERLRAKCRGKKIESYNGLSS